MKILFLSLADFNSINNSGIYTDLLREFMKNGHEICAVSPIEKRRKKQTYLIYDKGIKILKLKIGNITKTNFIEKGISTLLVEQLFIRGINKHFRDECFDLVLYATPPITFQKVILFVKKRDGAKSYLLLKDIWPQGMIDLKLLSTTGWKGLIYKYFKSFEKRLYANSDYIGCMSKANVDYILKHNPEIPKEKVEICPNSIEPIMIKKDDEFRARIRAKYDIPINKVVFLYGGNIGIPQGVDYIIECLKAIDYEEAFFVIIGSGTEFFKLKNFISIYKPKNVKLFEYLPKEEYENFANSCDIGLIFLDKCFTIPNIPSRMLSYMQASMPILAATDINTDIDEIIENGKFGLWCESNKAEDFKTKVYQLCNKEVRKQMGKNARMYLEQNYTTKQSYEIIIYHFNEEKY